MRIFLSILSLILTSGLLGQNVKFYASTDAAVLDAPSKTYQVLQNSEFQISFTLENGRGSQFIPPDFKGLTVISGPMNSTQTSIINGVRSEKKSYIYSVMGSREGSFKIGSGTIKTSRGVLSTNPFTIKVQKSVEGSVDDAQETFVKVVLSDSLTYIGQQITMQLRLYTTENVKSYEALTDYDYEGFYTKNLNEFARKSNREIINGKEYFTTTLKAVALFPQQTGTYNIPSFAVRVGVPKQSRRRSLFSFQEYNYKVLHTENRLIEVVDVPRGAPTSFSGAVGSFTAGFKIDKNAISTDDNFTITVEIRGDGDGKKILSPDLDLGSDFEVYEPNLLRDEDFVDGSKVINYKSFEYLVVPKKEGTFRLSPKFSFFGIPQYDYVTLQRKTPFMIRIVKGEGLGDDLSAVHNRNLLPNMPLDQITRPGYGFLSSVTHWGIMLIVFFGILGMMGHQYYLQKQSGIDPSILKRKKANKEAIKRLQQAKKFLDDTNERLFYDEITKTLHTYFQDKLSVSLGAYSQDEMLATIQELGVSVESSQQLKEVLQKSEIALFAGGKTGEMTSVYQLAEEIISSVEDSVIR